MKNEEFSKLILSAPNEVLRKIENKEIDISHIDFNVIKKRIEKKFLNADQIEAVESVYWATYMVEREVFDLISRMEKSLGNTDIVDALLTRLSFGDKISLLNERYNSGKQIAPFVHFAWKVNELRNAVAHGKFENLKYCGFNLSDRTGQFKFLIDLTAAFLESAKNISSPKL